MSKKTLERVLSPAEVEEINEAVNSYGKDVDEENRAFSFRVDPDDQILLSYPQRGETYLIKGPEAAERHPNNEGMYPELERNNHEGPVFFNEDERRELDKDSNLLIGDHGQVKDEDTENWLRHRLDHLNAYITANRDVVKIINFEEEEVTASIDGENYRI